MLPVTISHLHGLGLYRTSGPSAARPISTSLPARAAVSRRAPARQQRHLRIRAFDEEEEEDETRYEYPNPEFVKETLEAFPDQGVANVEEARALYSDGGWTYLDVRPKLEWDDIGHVRDAVNIPIKFSKRVYNAEKKKKLAQKSENPDFIKQVEKKFPNKEAPILIGCSDGRAYSMDALMQMDEAGYTCLAGLKGGYYAWFRTFTNKLERRKSGEYAETYTHSGDTSGIHASGAGFERSDFAGVWQPPEGY